MTDEELKQLRLTPKEYKFCEAYITNGYVGAAAYHTAYPDANSDTCKSNAWRLLRKPSVQAYINHLQREALKASQVNADRVALKLAEIAFAQKGDKDYNATAQLKALDLLQKQLGVQVQKLEAELRNEINIQIEE